MARFTPREHQAVTEPTPLEFVVPSASCVDLVGESIDTEEMGADETKVGGYHRTGRASIKPMSFFARVPISSSCLTKCS